MPGGLGAQMGEEHRNGNAEGSDHRLHRRRRVWRSVALHLTVWIAVATLLLLWLWPDRAK